MFLTVLKNKLLKSFNNELFTALNFDENSFQLIQLKKKNDSFVPIIHKTFSLSNILTPDGIFKNKEALQLFKKILSLVKQYKITVSAFENKKFQTEIITHLKMAGFQDVFLKQLNLNNILTLTIKTKNLVSRYPNGQKIFNALFLDNKIHFILSQNGIIRNKTIIHSAILNYNDIQEFLAHNTLDENEVYISGDIEKNLDFIKEMFYIFSLKTHVTNIWQNILNTEKIIPDIFFIESHQYLKAIALAIPNLLDLKDEPYQEIIKKETEEFLKKESLLTTKQETEQINDLLQISSYQKREKEKEILITKNNSEQKENKKENKKISIFQKIKNILTQEIKSTIIFQKKKKELKEKKEEEKDTTLMKLLPKSKEKIFLPKNKKRKKLPKRKKKKFLPKNKKKKRNR